jgi:hypothetical protein
MFTELGIQASQTHLAGPLFSPEDWVDIESARMARSTFRGVLGNDIGWYLVDGVDTTSWMKANWMI